MYGIRCAKSCTNIDRWSPSRQRTRVWVVFNSDRRTRRAAQAESYYTLVLRYSDAVSVSRVTLR